MNVSFRLLMAAAASALALLGGGCGMFATGGYQDPARAGSTAGGGSAGIDFQTTARVNEALASAPVYKFPNVMVATQSGVVQLSGFVLTQEQKQQAEQVARQTVGVSEVINNITVRQAGTAPGQTGQSAQPQPQRQPQAQPQAQPTR